MKKALLLLMLASPSWATFSGYTYRKTVTIPKAKVGTSGGLTQSNFPVLISLNDNSLSTTTASGGRLNSSGMDLIFSTMSDCSFSLFWDTETVQNVGVSTMNVWVNIPTLSTTTDVSATFFMCYGNSGVTTYQGISMNTWDSSYKGVWHVSDGTTLNKNDSTSNANNLSNFGSPTPAAGTGQIDGALSLSGSTGYIGKSSPSNLPTGSTARTLEAWTKINSLATSNTLIQFGDVGNTRQTYLLYALSAGCCSANFSMATWADDLTSPTTLSAGVWYHVVATYDGSLTLKLYLNGSLDTTYTLGGALNTTLDINGVSLGAWPGASAHYMNGIIDEARISNISRSADWITTEYNNQNSPSTFIIISGETVDSSGVNRGLKIQGGKTTIKGGKVTIL